jgi:hypothetical protein
LPWYGYLLILTRGPFAPLDLLVALVLVAAWVRCPRHLLTWATAPLALVHCAIAHKELRFLFPIAMLSPVLLALAFRGVAWRGWARALAGVVVAFDLVALTALCVLPAEPQVAFLGFVAERFPSGLEGYMASPTSPWVWHELTMYFYGRPPAELRPWPGASPLVAAGVTRFELVTSSWEGPPPADTYACRPVYRSLPDWLPRVGAALAGPKPPAPEWDLFRCRRAPQ